MLGDALRRQPEQLLGERVLTFVSVFECVPMARHPHGPYFPGDDQHVRVMVLELDGTMYWFQQGLSVNGKSVYSSETFMRQIRVCMRGELPADADATEWCSPKHATPRGSVDDREVWEPGSERPGIMVTVRSRRHLGELVMFGVCERTGLVVFEVGTEVDHERNGGMTSFVSRWVRWGYEPNWLEGQEDAA